MPAASSDDPRAGPELVAEYQPACRICGRPSATIRVVARGKSRAVVYRGIVGESGPNGVAVTPEEIARIAAAFTPPYDGAKIRAAGFHDDAGFCETCGCFYCAGHWTVSATGGGTCPRGHFKSLDPHWSPA